MRSLSTIPIPSLVRSLTCCWAKREGAAWVNSLRTEYDSCGSISYSWHRDAQKMAAIKGSMMKLATRLRSSEFDVSRVFILFLCLWKWDGTQSRGLARMFGSTRQDRDQFGIKHRRKGKRGLVLLATWFWHCYLFLPNPSASLPCHRPWISQSLEKICGGLCNDARRKKIAVIARAVSSDLDLPAAMPTSAETDQCSTLSLCKHGLGLGYNVHSNCWHLLFTHTFAAGWAIEVC